MRFSLATVAAFALGVAAVPAQQNGVDRRAPQIEPALEERSRPTWGDVSWETRSWGEVTWTAPVGAPTPPSPWTTPAQPPPPESSPPPPPPSPCLTPAQATVVANNFRDTIASPFSTALAEAAFASTFTDYSDSVIELMNSGCNGPIALGSPTFSSLQEFVGGQGSQPPIPFTILNLWNTCNSVHIRWDSTPGPGGPASPQQQVTGLIAIEVVPNTVPDAAQPWLIQTVYSEFNSGAWLYDLGVFVPTNCTAA